MARDWNEVLDALDERVEAHRRVLYGETALCTYELPQDLGPLPLELAGRACAILARQQEVEAEITAHMSVLRNLFAKEPPVPIYLDKSA